MFALGKFGDNFCVIAMTFRVLYQYGPQTRRRVLGNRAPSNAGRRFWELSGGILFCPCGRRMAAHTVTRRKGHPSYYYVCGLRRSGQGPCEHGASYHRAEETERKVRALVLGFLGRPEEVRRRAEEYVQSERGRLTRAGRELSGWEGRLADTQRRRSALIDLAADGTITRWTRSATHNPRRYGRLAKARSG